MRKHPGRSQQPHGLVHLKEDDEGHPWRSGSTVAVLVLQIHVYGQSWMATEQLQLDHLRASPMEAAVGVLCSSNSCLLAGDPDRRLL